MCKILTLVLLFSAVCSTAQTPTITADTTPPTLDVANQLAIQACEKAKLTAKQQFSLATSQEQTILSQWATAHPGWEINPQTFAVQIKMRQDKPVTPATPVKSK